MTTLPTVEGGFRVIVADPPWTFKSRGKNGDDRAPDYSLMSITDIKNMGVADIAARDCHLFLWVTGPHLPMAFEVMKAWGFRYSGMGFTWIKLKRSFHSTAGARHMRRTTQAIEAELAVGMGYTTRKNAEFCLLGRRGSPRRLSAAVREVIVSPVREHSRKPDEFFNRVETYAAGPYCELFARQSREGWSSFGNETTKFDEEVELSESMTVHGLRRLPSLYDIEPLAVAA